MKVIVAGGRDFNDYELLEKNLDILLAGKTDITIVSGKAKGADSLGEKYAKKHGLPVDEFPANWHTYGRSAGPIRNDMMAKWSQMLVAFWDGKSHGTKDMIDRAKQLGLEVHVIGYQSIVQPPTSKVYLASVSNINKIPEGVKRFFIARQALSNMEKYDLIWLYNLAPSHDLLVGSKSKKIAWPEYVKTYRREMLMKQKILDKLETALENGESIAFICYCPKSDHCHRGLVGNYYKEIGFDVIEI